MNMLQERKYYIQPTKEGIFLILIQARNEDAYDSYLQYDGRDNALFLRTPKECILLDYINPTVHADLLKSAFVEMLEIRPEEEEVIRDYRVPLHKVPEIYVA